VLTNAEIRDMQYHATEHICLACRYDLDRLVGPVHGPAVPPAPRARVERWSMTPAEWAGGWL
jgi:hypothetical protein